MQNRTSGSSESKAVKILAELLHCFLWTKISFFGVKSGAPALERGGNSTKTLGPDAYPSWGVFYYYFYYYGHKGYCVYSCLFILKMLAIKKYRLMLFWWWRPCLPKKTLIQLKNLSFMFVLIPNFPSYWSVHKGPWWGKKTKNNNLLTPANKSSNTFSIFSPKLL